MQDCTKVKYRVQNQTLYRLGQHAEISMFAQHFINGILFMNIPKIKLL
jgi:hypothetical protein